MSFLSDVYQDKMGVLPALGKLLRGKVESFFTAIDKAMEDVDDQKDETNQAGCQRRGGTDFDLAAPYSPRREEEKKPPAEDGANERVG